MLKNLLKNQLEILPEMNNKGCVNSHKLLVLFIVSAPTCTFFVVVVLLFCLFICFFLVKNEILAYLLLSTVISLIMSLCLKMKLVITLKRMADSIRVGPFTSQLS